MLKVKVRITGANCCEIDTDDGTYLQSYNTVIAFRSFKDRKIYLDREKWNYSVTTAKHRNAFLNETTKETQRKIDQGIYVLANLN